MAEATPPKSRNDSKEEKSDTLECAVCLQPCIHPAVLPCGHIFCFLCVKGIANQSKRCAMCRQVIPLDFIDQPTLLQRPNSLPESEGFDGGYQWYYEGRNGWWQYDERTSKELENCYKKGDKSCELLIAGFLYVVDLESMVQLRRNDPTRRRSIKRDFSSIPKKGIAGLRTGENLIDAIQETRPHSPVEGSNGTATPVTPSNTPQSPTSGRESPRNQDLQVTVEMIGSLRLDNDNNLVNNLNRASRFRCRSSE